MPKISVIIPLYNKEKTIKKTIESVLNQTFTEYEIIVVNDGSTDRSLEIVKRINDSRIRIIDKDNEGVSTTRNRGFNEANGDWLLFLDADDLLEHRTLEILTKQISKYPMCLAHTANYETIYNDNKVVSFSYIEEGVIRDPFKYIWEKKWNMRLGAYIVKKELVEKIGGFHDTITIGEDNYFNWKILQETQVSYIQYIAMYYDLRCNELSHRKFAYNRHIEHYMTLPKEYPYLQKIESALILKHYFRGIWRRDPMYTIKSLKETWYKIPQMIYFLLRRL